MNFRCLGGFGEVGRNGVLLDTGSERILFDYGIKTEESEIPLKAGKVDGTLLTHPHLDHSGVVPTIKAPIYSTAASLDQARLLLKDSIKVARLNKKPEFFSERDIKNMRENRVTYGQQFEIGNSLIDVYDAGHVPGSAGFLVEAGGKRIFYTGDYKMSATRLLNGARFDLGDIDILFTESTYSNREHADRSKTEKRLKEIIEQTLANDGIVLIPVFAVGRAAELLMVIDSFKIDAPKYLDGMAKEATEIALRYPEMLRDHKALEKAVEHVIPLYTNKDRQMAIKRPSIIISTSGMLTGGPVSHFIKKLYKNEKCSIAFTGFQVQGTPGRVLIETGHYVKEDEDIDLEVKMNINYLDFSAHSGRSELIKFIKKTNPGKVVCMHGDRCEDFALELQEMGFDAIAPKNGDNISI